MLEDMKRDKKYWIITKIKFELEPEGQSDSNASCVTFMPPKSEFLSSYEKLMKDMVSTAEDVNRVTS
jgi:hypothetical protein